MDRKILLKRSYLMQKEVFICAQHQIIKQQQVLSTISRGTL